MSTCSLKKLPDGSYDKASVRLLNKDINEVFEKAIADSGGVDAIALKFSLKKGLLKLGANWNNSQIAEITKQVKAIADELMLSDYLPKSVENTLSKKYNSAKGVEEDISLEQYQGAQEDRIRNSWEFVDNVYTDVKRKNKLKLRAAYDLLCNFVIDRDNEMIISNAVEANANVRKYKNKIFKEVIDYLNKTYGCNIEVTLLFDENGEYNNGMFDTLVLKYISLFESNALEDINSLTDEQLQIFNSLFILKNYDKFVNAILGKSVVIDPTKKYTFTSGDIYSFATKHNDFTFLWNNDDNVNLETEINKLVQSLVSTIPYRVFGVENPGNGFIKFEDFYNSIIAVKDLGLDYRAGNIIIERSNLNTNFVFDFLNESESRLIDGLSLRAIVNNIRNNPLLYARVAFLLLSKESIIGLFDFNEDEKNNIYSIYRGLFQGDKSIYDILQKSSRKGPNYYESIAQTIDGLFSVDFIQYSLDEDLFEARSLRMAGIDLMSKQIENVINEHNSRKIIGMNFQAEQLEPYSVQPYSFIQIEQEGEGWKLFGLKYKIGDIEITYNAINDQLSLLKKDENHNNLVLSKEDKENLFKSTEFKKFIDKQLGYSLNDSELCKQLANVLNGESGAVEDLLKLSSHVMFNKYIFNSTKEDLELRGRKDINAKSEQIYGLDNDCMPKYNPFTGEISMVSKHFKPLLNKLARAKAVTTGTQTSILVRDSNGNMLSTQTLSRLLGSLPSLFEMIKKNNKSPLKNFLFMQDGVYKGFFNAKELKGKYGSKDATTFTVNEAVTANFLYDFVAGFINNKTTGNKIIGNNTIGLYPAIFSDKNTIGVILIDLNTKITNQTSKFYGKAIKDLNIDQLHELTREQFSVFYDNLQANINSDFAKLQEFCPVVITPLNDFREFNDYARSIGQDSYELLMTYVKKYNDKYPNDHINIIDLTHCIRKGNKILFNNSLRFLQRRFSNPEAYNNFMMNKRSEMLVDLLKKGFNLNLSERYDSLNPKSYLQSERFKDWIDPKTGMMYLARIPIKLQDGTITYSYIRKISDLPNEAMNNPHNLTNVELHPMVELYNTYDFLFGLLFLFTGVGMHPNHPLKAKLKTPIVWGHPATGKTSMLNSHPELREKFMDWDEFYNAKRDNWIRNHPIDGITDFHLLRNEYLINTESHPEYVAFLKELWEDAKIYANNLNKILLASPAILLKLFEDDFDTIINLEEDDFIARGIARGDKNPKGWKEGIQSVFDNLKTSTRSKIFNLPKGEYLSDSLIKGRFNNKLNQLAMNESIEEAGRFKALDKRNVSYTAAMHPFLLDMINGIPTEYNLAIIEDVKDLVYTITGDTDKATPYDGATFVNPFIVWLENYSLKEDKAGVDKKLFHHCFDSNTGTGVIIKTAGYGLTNNRIKNSKFYRTMMKNMTDRKWKNADGTDHEVRGNGILEDYEGNAVDYGTFYYKATEDGLHYYQATLDRYNPQTKCYELSVVEVDKDGGIKGEVTRVEKHCESNYDVWLMFGGYNSLEINSSGELQDSEKSIALTVLAINNYGIKYNKNLPAEFASDMYQPMKAADVHYMVTAGAIKQGAANINSNKFFYDSSSPLNVMKAKMLQGGIQLDKEHHADLSVLSLMTLVISAAASKGFTFNESSALYNSLYELTKEQTKEFRNSLGLLVFGDKAEFDKSITKLLIDSVRNSSVTDGNLIYNIAKDIIREINSNPNFLFTDDVIKRFDVNIPYSDNSIFNKIVSDLTVAMTKKGIKLKMPGILAVLNPSYGVNKLYKVPVLDENGEIVQGQYHYLTYGLIEDKFPGFTAEDALKAYLDLEPEISNPVDLKIGRNYIFDEYDDFGNYIGKKIVSLKFPHEYNKGNNVGYKFMKQQMLSLKYVNVKEYIIDGKELDTYDVRFKGIGSDNIIHDYQICDLDIVLDLFRYKENPYLMTELISKYGLTDLFIDKIQDTFKDKVAEDEELLTYIYELRNADTLDNNVLFSYSAYNKIKNVINRIGANLINYKLLQTLNGISKTGKETTVLVNGSEVIVDKNSVLHQAYGIIMPKTFKTNFMLELFDVLSDIIHDKDFFTKRLMKRMSTKIEFYQDLEGNEKNNFHIELKRADGKHIYIRRGLTGSDLQEKTVFTSTDEDGKVTRIDGEGNPIYQMYQGDKIYTDREGNEVIVTESNDGIKFYLDNLDYIGVHISDYCSNNEFNNFLEVLDNSENKVTLRYVKNLLEYPIPSNRRKIARELNDYSDGNIEKHKNLQKIGNMMMTSFKASLNVIAARIPAQSQQSFMGMRVESFIDDDVNSALVSTMLFFLQGSDLDIDAVSIQTFDFDKNGMYVGHSPFFDLSSDEAYKESLKLPFPTGESVLISETNDPTEATINQLIKFIGSRDALLPISLNKSNLVTVRINPYKNINDAIELLKIKEFKECHTDNFYALFNKITSLGYTNAQIDELQREIVKAIDKHNLYLQNCNSTKRVKLLRNYATRLLYDIITNPINLIESLTAIDRATSPLKEIAKTSVKANDQNLFTPGNAVNKLISVAENMIGKDGISICATGLKTLFALNQQWNNVLRNGTTEEKLALLKPVNILGIEYKGLANAFADVDLETEQLIKDYLYEQAITSGVATDYSALLSLSTDNAKELVLAKINANTATLGMYLYGLSLGVPFESLYKIMTSPLMWRLTELTQGNFFNNDMGTYNISGSLNYLLYTPSFDRFNIADAGDNAISISEILSKKIANLEKVREINKKLPENLKQTLPSLDLTNDELNLVSPDVRSIYSKHYYLAVEFYQQYQLDKSLKFNKIETEFGTYDAYDAVCALAYGAEEMKSIGKILRLNLEIKTNPMDLLTLVQNVELAIYNLHKRLNNYLRWTGNKAEKILPYVKTTDILEGGEKIDLMRFVSDPEYAKEAEKRYDQYKASYNPLSILRHVVHYKGYLESMAIAHQGLLEKAAKYNIDINKAVDFIGRNNISDLKLIKSVFKNTENAFSYYVLNKFLKEQKITLIAKPGSKLFVDDLNSPRIIYDTKRITLGNELGNANFKLYMEQVIIPQLKEKYPENKFILQLQPSLNLNTASGYVSTNYTLNINMMPRSEYETDLFLTYKLSFNELSTLPLYSDGTNNFGLKGLFYLYSMICNNGRVGQNSLHGIFIDYISSHSGYGHDFRVFEGLLEHDPNFIEDVSNYITDEMMAPFGNPYVGGSNLMKYKSRSDDKVYYLKKLEEQSNNDYDDGYEYSESYDDYSDEYYQSLLGDYDVPGIQTKTTIGNYDIINNTLQLHNNANTSFFYNISTITELQNLRESALTSKNSGNYNIAYDANTKEIIELSGQDLEIIKLLRTCIDAEKKKGNKNNPLMKYNSETKLYEINKDILLSIIDAKENNCL